MSTQRPIETDAETYNGILHVVDVALKEDIRTGDITSQACLSPDDQISGRLLLKQGGRLAGLAFLEPLFKKVDPRVEVKLFVEEGGEHRAGTILGTISGPAWAIFAGERVALNLLQHASGVATLTSYYVERTEGYDCDILDTRRTLPGLRCLERYAVRLGGGKNHRIGLDDRFIIKHNHLSFIARNTKHPIIEAVRRARAHRANVPIEVEVDDLKQIDQAVESGADIILLDHMPLPQVRKAVSKIKQKGKAYVEGVGGVNLETVDAFAEAGLDGISVPALTFQAQPLEIALRF
ncbi:MAG: carboxylating nicotinate-nucleotide diphosphorylase [Parachlamydiales bacterium]